MNCIFMIDIYKDNSRPKFISFSVWNVFFLLSTCLFSQLWFLRKRVIITDCMEVNKPKFQMTTLQSQLLPLILNYDILGLIVALRNKKYLPIHSIWKCFDVGKGSVFSLRCRFFFLLKCVFVVFSYIWS